MVSNYHHEKNIYIIYLLKKKKEILKKLINIIKCIKHDVIVIYFKTFLFEKYYWRRHMKKKNYIYEIVMILSEIKQYVEYKLFSRGFMKQKESLQWFCLHTDTQNAIKLWCGALCCFPSFIHIKCGKAVEVGSAAFD